MARSKPTRKITLTFADVTETNVSGLLYPCLIGPRYVLHKFENGNAFAGHFTAGKSLVAEYPEHIDDAIIDYQKASVQIANYWLCVGENLTVTGPLDELSPNSLVFKNAVAGSTVDSGLINAYNVRIGDKVEIGKKLTKVIDVRPVTVAASGSATTIAGATSDKVVVDVTDAKNSEEIVYVIQVTSSDMTSVVADIACSTGDIESGNAQNIKFVKGQKTAIGTKGVSLTFGTDFSFDESDNSNNVIIVRALPEREGDYRIVYVDQDVSTLLNKDEDGNTTDTIVNVYSQNVGSAVMSLAPASFTVSSSEVTINDAVSINLAGTVYSVKEADVYVNYREQLVSETNVLVAGDSTGLADFIGEISPENPLAMMAYCAQLAGTSAFYVMAVESEDYSSYVKAIDVALRYENVFSPITHKQTPDVIAYLKKKQAEYNAPEIAQFKKLWIADNTEKDSVIFDKTKDGVSLMFTSVTQGDKGVVTLLKGDLIEAGVVAGDVLVIPNYYNAKTKSYVKKSYTISKVTGTSSIEIRKPDVAFTTPVIGYIIRNLSNLEYAEVVANKAAGYNSPFINYVWADHPVCTGYGEIGMNYLAVTLAALRAASAPHAPLSDVVVPGWTVADTYSFSDADLDIMNNKGVWIVFQDRFGSVVTRHQLTTTQDGTMAEEDSAVSNACNIVRSLRSMLYKYRGDANVQSAMINSFYLDLVVALGDIAARAYPDKIGSQLISYGINSLVQDPDNKARLLLSLNLEVPEPFLDGDYQFNII